MMAQRRRRGTMCIDIDGEWRIDDEQQGRKKESPPHFTSEVDRESS